ncbi:MAG: PP2C family protein-serine/threonine phosphatase [Holophagales bacterium]|nr:PP2C family protein-serine/threonine phosphatase [Holophagales bacterium]
MRAPFLVDLALLSDEQAERRHFDAWNFRRGRIVWYLFVVFSVGGLIGSLAEGLGLRAAALGVNLIALAAIARSRRRLYLHPRFAQILIVALAVESALFTALPTAQPIVLVYGVLVLPFLFLLLRLRFLDAAVVVCAVLATLAVTGVLRAEWAGDEADGPSPLVTLLTTTFIGGGAAAFGAGITRRYRVDLLADLARARGDARERLRMREELESARAIQLAMLPREPPRPGWLELAAACAPATEVGGDYYDYFEIAPERLVVAIGDVAGHGVASGIVLSGVRAGLHLLSDQLDEPPLALDRLNRLVRETGPDRLLMTLGLARFDAAAGTLSWSSAGQPAALRYCGATGEISALAGTLPPLGTRLPVRYEALQAPLEPGDVWLFVSDGIPEALDDAGEAFGEARLASELAAAAGEGLDAEEVRDRLLAAVARHRGGAEADDDLTLVVARRIAS